MVSVLCRELAGVESYTHIVEPLYELSPELSESLSSALKRIVDGEPLQYVLGYEYFCGHRFCVNPSVLIPRPETQELCDMALKELSHLPYGAKVLDLCTGSGCIAWTVAAGCAGADVTAVDISEDALRTAVSQDIGCPSPHFVRADVLVPDFSLPSAPFDLLLSNPPYVLCSEKASMRENVLGYEPSLALFVPDDDPLLFYRAIASACSRLLKPGGCGILEINEAFGREVASLFSSAGYCDVSLIRDFRDRDRFIRFC